MTEAGFTTENTIHEVLGIRSVEMTPERVVLEMDVTSKVHQVFGILHGGASAVIAESAASIGAGISRPDRIATGIELNISHLRAKGDGTVRATATPIRKGRTLHVWGIDITDEEGEMVAVARCTIAIRPLPSERRED
jgi:uncharacterized protein (TIGR00369 family)